MTDSTIPPKKDFFKKGDFILFACFLTLSAILLLFNAHRCTEGTTVTVTVDGTLVGRWSLSEDTLVDINGSSGTNRLLISDGTASIATADCPDLICVRHLPVSHSGERIVCLPNRVIVTVDADSPDTLDAISQ